MIYLLVFLTWRIVYYIHCFFLLNTITDNSSSQPHRDLPHSIFKILSRYFIVLIYHSLLSYFSSCTDKQLFAITNDVTNYANMVVDTCLQSRFLEVDCWQAKTCHFVKHCLTPVPRNCIILDSYQLCLRKTVSA